MFNRVFYSKAYQVGCQIFWAAAVLMLPFSSLPGLARLSHASSVAPVTTFLLLILALVWWLPSVLLGGVIPAESVPLAWFFWAGLISSALAYFRPIPPFHDATLPKEMLSGLATLMLGLAVFFTTTSWLRSKKNAIRRTLRLVHISSFPMLGWSLLQIFFVLAEHSAYPQWLYAAQAALSVSPVSLYMGRATGLAFEPSWLAHQLNIVYLPLWLASSLSGVSVFRRFGRFSLENLLLLVGLFVLVMSFSRVGWLSFGLVGGLIALGAIGRLAGWVDQRLWQRRAAVGKVFIRFLTYLVLLAAGLAAGLGLAVILFRIGVMFEPRLGLILERNPFGAENFYDFANRLFIGERVVYWSAGAQVFNAFPIIGAGIGTAGFYFPTSLPAFAFGLVEVQSLMYRLTVGFNIKSLWVRLLAETGLLGFAIFVGWYMILVFSALKIRNACDPLLRLCGVFGIFVLAGFLVEGFSIDSFALPYFWFSAGLIAAAGSLGRAEAASGKDSA